MVQPLPQPFEVSAGPVLQAMRLGSADRLAEEQRGALKTAGGFAAKGQLGQARNYLYSQGMMEEADKFGAQIRQADADALAKVHRSQAVLGNLALAADTPEKWAAAVGAASQSGMDVSKFKDFGSRDMLLAQSGMMGERIELEMKRREQDIKAQGGGNAPSGYRATPGGNLAFIPGGPADPATNNKQVKYTEGQTKAANFGNMMQKAEGELEGSATQRGPQGQPVVTNPKNFFGAVRDGIVPFEGLRNAMRPDQTQAYEQAANQWIRAKLRKESGAAIGIEEMRKEFETYFPQYWDGPETIARKARARAEAQRGMVSESGGSYEQFFPQQQQAAPGAAPAASANPADPLGILGN